MSLVDGVWRQIRQGIGPDGESVRSAVGESAPVLGDHGLARAEEALGTQVLGLGELEGILADQLVTDIAVNGDGRVWVDRGRGMQLSPVRLVDSAAVHRLAVRLAALAGRRLDESNAWVDGQLPSGLRLHAVLPPLVSAGPHITLRVPSRISPSLEWLVSLGMMPDHLAQILRTLVSQGRSVVISGGTGTGKTTLLAALLREVDPGQRIVAVEDVSELMVDHPQLVRLEARQANVEGVGLVPMEVLVRQALRMRPDRLVVGEARGAEVRELLAALNTGHRGGCCTVHANSSADVVARFEALGSLAGLDLHAVHAQLASAVDVVVHLARERGRRFVEEIAVLTRATPGQAPVVRTAVRCDGDDIVWGPARQELGL